MVPDLIVERAMTPDNVPPQISDTRAHGQLNAQRPGARDWQKRSY
jgi:hypothetical protein